MANPKDLIKKVSSALEESGATRVKVAVTDIDGVLRGKYVHKDKFFSVLENGMGFCNVVFGWDANDVCYDNVKFTGWHSGYPDGHVSLDPDTFRRIPWEGGLPFFLGDFEDGKGKPLGVCSRAMSRAANAPSMPRPELKS